MTSEEIQSGLSELCAEIGPNAMVIAQLGSGWRGMHVSVYPADILGKVHLRAKVQSFEEIVPTARAIWKEHEALHAANTVKSLAIAIIRLTAEHGECTDRALRCEFSPQDVERYGEKAETLATEMGAAGPFTIVRTGPGNMIDEAA